MKCTWIYRKFDLLKTGQRAVCVGQSLISTRFFT